MLTVKDLSVSKEMDRQALTEVRGGSNYSIVNGQFVAQGGGIAIGSPNLAIKADVVTQNDNDANLILLSPLSAILDV